MISKHNDNCDQIIELDNLKLINFGHTVFYAHVRDGFYKHSTEVAPGDYIIRAKGEAFDWNYQTFLVSTVKNNKAYVCMVDREDCALDIVESCGYGQDIIEIDVECYIEDIEIYNSETVKCAPKSKESNCLSMFISSDTILFNNGKIQKIIQDQIINDNADSNTNSIDVFSCDVKVGLVIAAKKDNLIEYKVVESVNEEDETVLLRCLPKDVIGDFIVNKIEKAFEEQTDFFIEHMIVPLIID